MVKKEKLFKKRAILTYGVLCVLIVLIIFNSVGILNSFWEDLFSSSPEIGDSQSLDRPTRLRSFSLAAKGDNICGDSFEVTIGGRLSGGFFEINGKDYLVKEGRIKNTALMALVSVNNAETGIEEGDSEIINGLLVYVEDIREEIEFGEKVYYADLILGENEVSSPEDCGD